ncbi:MAG: pyridoxal phosphate-dependent aminotransferase, partial [Ornithinimicrobium sp.]
MTAEITRLSGLTTSLIRSFAAAAPPENVSLALGEPGWPLPEVARDALRRWALEADLCLYGPNQGIDELRSAIVHRVSVPDDRVMVTAGSQAALYAVITAHVEPGWAVALPDPGFPAYRTLTHLAGGTALTYPLAGDGSLDAPALIDALDRHTRVGAAPVRMLILNHPGNPTGGGATPAALAEVAQACATRDIIVVSDEVYRELPYAAPQPSLRDVTDEGIVTESVSKA